jgi:hypothetical protein
LPNLFGRHPAVKIISIENGSSWLRPLLKNVDEAAALGRRGPMLGLREASDYVGRLAGATGR